MEGLAAFRQRALELAAPLSVHLELTYTCNWRCVFCYNPRRFDRHRLSRAEWSEVLDDLRSLGTLTVTLTGGEPLAHPEFLGVAEDVRARALALRVFTNGSLVDDELAPRLAALRPLTVELSLHGATPEVHDRATGRPGSYVAMWAAIRRLKDAGAPLLLKTPLTQLNFDELEAMVALAAREALPYRIDPVLTPRDDGDRSPLAYALDAPRLNTVMKWLAGQGLLPKSGERTPGGSNCGLGRLTLAVDPEGYVFPCLQWRQQSLGNVRERRLREMWPGSAERQAAAQVAVSANSVLLQIGEPASSFP